ncbi:MAG TPA: hypothetical protein DEQ28_00410 [Clostridiales bacterium]|nr:hypothetical protein [Clostridiales bacterium]
MTGFVPFDETRPRLVRALEHLALPARGLSELLVVRDLMGRIRLLVPEQPEPGPELEQALGELTRRLHQELGVRSYEPEQGVLSVDKEDLEALKKGALRHEVQGLTIYLVDRLITGSEWATISSVLPHPRTLRFTLFSIKGGVGRSTTAAVLATHLARKGRRVLVMDLDLESPGVSSMLLAREEHPDFGIVDWFVEDLVGQGDEVVRRMIGRPSWGQDFRGDILVAPAYGSEPREYLAKLGRVYLDRPPDGDQPPEGWTMRLLRLMQAMEEREKPDVVLLDSRNGLHDLAAAAVTDLQAQVLLFGMDTEATWTAYRILFEHWHSHGVAPSIRERLSVVAALLPETQPDAYLSGFRERAWDLFCKWLYDEVPANSREESEIELFSFDLADEGAPHNPFPIHWNRGLATLSSLRDLDESVVSLAYERFLERFDLLFQALSEEPQ